MLRRDPGGLTRFFDIEESDVDAATSFVSRKVESLNRWWVTANAGRMPSRKMFDIVDHKPIIPNLFLTEVTPRREFVFRLLGEDVIQIIGTNRTGEVVERGAEGEYGHALLAYYDSIVAGRRCRRCVGSLAFANETVRRFESVDCPLSDASGERVEAIIGAMDLIG